MSQHQCHFKNKTIHSLTHKKLGFKIELLKVKLEEKYKKKSSISYSKLFLLFAQKNKLFHYNDF